MNLLKSPTAAPDFSGVDEKSPIDPGHVEAAFGAALAQYPRAPLAAINDFGMFVAMPDSIETGARSVVSGRSALDLVIPADRVVVIDAWERARSTGAAQASVRLRGNGDRPVMLQIFDVRAQHGVFVLFVVGADRSDELVAITDAPPIAPRLALQRKNDTAVIIAVDQAFTQMLGWRAEEIVGKGSLEFIHPEDQDRAIETWMEMLAAPGSRRRARLRHRRADDGWMWLEITNHNLLLDEEHGCVLAEVLDISDEMAAHEAVRAREQLLHRIAETMPLGLVQVDRDGNVVYTNERLHEIVGCGPSTSIELQLASVVHEDWSRLEHAITAVLRDATDADLEVRVQDPIGFGTRQCRFSLRALTSEAARTTGAIMCVEDVTDSARMREELENRATYDALTGCLNRAAVMTSLADALVGRESVGVVFVDLDGFKQVNDALGHAVGDELLVAVADRLRGVVREGDVVGRLGGDEFLIVCPGVTRPEEALTIARRVVEANHEAVLIGSEVVVTRASVGVAVSSAQACDADSVVANADVAMYESKRQGRGEAVLYAQALRDAMEADDGGEPRTLHVRGH